MNPKTSIPLALGVAILCLLLNPSVTQAAAIPAAYDALETDSNTTFEDLILPADFFGPGSDPFVGRVYLEGIPFDCFDPDGPGIEPNYCGLLPTDTIVRRLADAGPTFPSTIPIEIVQLSLKSVSPLTVSFGGGASFQTWEMNVQIQVDPATGLVNPPQSPGSMLIRHENPDGGTFDSMLPVEPLLTFVRLDAPGTIGPMPPPGPLTFQASAEPWCHVAKPLGFPAGHVVVEVPGLTNNYFPGVFCANTGAVEPPVSFSVDGGVFNPARSGGTPLTPVPNPAEGLIVPDPRHPNPNDVYAVGTSPGGQGYATEGEVFQAAGSPLGSPANQTNVDRMSAALGIGPAPGGPVFMGPFLPNPGGATPAPGPPGVPGPPGSFGPPPGNAVGTLGLVPNDNIDALSYGRDSGNVLLFSVDPATVGVVGSAVLFEAATSPFMGAAAPPFPTNPGGGDPGDEAAGDIFKSLQLGNFGSYIPLHFANGQFLTPAVLFVNQLAMDELLLGLQAPALNGSAILPPEDDLDGLEMSDTGDLVFGVDVVDNSTGTVPPDGIPDRHVFFSLDTASPSNGLVVVPMTATADDILVTPPGGFAFAVYADGLIDIGLLAGDDLDALAVSDVGVLGVLDPGLDEALFSLHPGSPYVLVGPDGVPGTGDEVSPADVFYTTFVGTFSLYAGSGTLGLRVKDNLNALDIQPAVIHPQPVPPPPPPPCPCKKLTVEQALLASHGIRVPEKKPCFHVLGGDFEVEIFGLGTFPVRLSGPSEVESGPRAFDPETARSEISTEIVSMDLAGVSLVGPVRVTAGRGFGLPPSTGKITGTTPGLDFPAESFFDVFIQIEVGGFLLHNEEPFRVEAVIHEIPPFGETYTNPPSQPPIPLYDELGGLAGFINQVAQTSSCQADSDCDDGDPCTSDTCDFAAGSCLHIPFPDSDGDGVCDDADNCPLSPNPGGQAPLVFGQEITAPSDVEFCWGRPADILWVRGDLANMGGYLIDLVQTVGGAVCIVDLTLPLVGQGFYYLVKEECPAGSWQTSLGVEPERDLALP